ncbi:phenylacetate--CoA ligase [Kocuria rhizophila]|uniref:Phenylacetate-coenzyme A ligase n=2 Tax=Kocuria rhizophila TaxID=72000 RepID=A0AAX2SA05_KOCRH|nr:AMP-binding protein [Bacillus sp. BGMRC0062]PMR90049.1 phenylacetate--CoA ligase [Kocuria rhizophila]TFH99170.1 phenylacetate--CoA ligase [Kocuria rhizophila]TFI11883.1 phenylacetate--CoA ligase [Kocuria rhizophila]
MNPMTSCSVPNPYRPEASQDPSQPDPEELMSRDQIEALQTERLNWTLHYAYENVPTYKELFDEHGVHPDDFRDLEDLAKFPYTDKEFLRKAYPFKSFATPMSEIRRIHASSGTTGQPTVVAYTEEDLLTWGSLVARCFRMSGIKPGDKVHNAYGYGLFTGGLGAHYGAERLGCAVIPMSGGQTEKQVQLIRDFEPEAILSTPTYLLTIADGFRKLGFDPRETSLKHAVLGAEPWTEEMRHEIEKTFDITACDIYGLSEVMGPGVAGESFETKDGSHIWEDHFRPEIIDPFDDTVLPTGRPGELVFTALTKQALPIIRYRTHDLTRLLPGTARPGHRRMGRITGRSDDMIILRGVNLFPSQIEELALKIPALSPHFTLEITRPHRMDQMTIHIERREDATVEEAQEAGRVLQHEIKTKIGSSAAIDIAEPGTLERSSGKLRRVYDRRDK